MLARLALPLALLSLAVPLQQPSTQTSTGTGLVVGQVVDGSSGKPIGGVTVTISGTITLPENAVSTDGRANVAPPFPSRQVLTDAEGHFVFAALPPGRFAFNATKQGYLSGSYGQAAPSSQVLGFSSVPARRLDLLENERRSDVKISIWKSATISGTVVDEAGEPVIGVQVRSARRGSGAGSLAPGLTQTSDTTDDRGMYRLAGLSPGTYIVMIGTTRSTAPATLQGMIHDATFDSSSDHLRDQLTANGVSFNSFIGVPVGSFVLSSGNDSTLGSGPRLPIPVITDERKIQVYETTYYPAATTVGRAGVIMLKSGDDRSNIDFQLKPVSTVRVSGTVMGPGGPAGLVGLNLTRTEVEDQLGNLAFDTATTISDASGAFTFLGVTPGQYTLRVLKTPIRPATTSGMTTVIEMGTTRISSSSGPSVMPPIPQEPTLSATQPVSVGDTDLSGVTVNLTTGGRLSGRIQFDGNTAPPAADRIQQMTVTLDPLSARARTIGNAFTILRGQFDAAGRFSTYQLPNGSYVLRPAAPPNWTLKAITLKGQDVMDTPIELTGTDIADIVFVYTDATTQLSGTVLLDNGQADSTAVVLVFPADPAKWQSTSTGSRRLRGDRASALGTFSLVGLPPGEYCVIAVQNDQIASWPDPSFLQTLSGRATRVTLGDGDKKTVDLKTAIIR